MKNIYVVTHTESLHHVQQLLGGWYDTSLTENGREQARKIAENLYNEIGERNIPIYSSDLKRCAEMADIFAEVFGSTIILDSNLREASSGDGDGKTEEWLMKHIIPKPVDGNRLDHQAFNNHETRRKVGTRIQNSLNQIVGIPDDNVIVITHGFALTFIIMAWLKVPVEHMDYCFFQTGPGGVTLLHEDDFFENRFVICVDNHDFLED